MFARLRNLYTLKQDVQMVKYFSDHPNPGANMHRVNNLEKRFLVWTKKYKTLEDVPNLVAAEVVDRARNRMRIRIANYMMAATLVACLFVAWAGKKAAERGDSVLKQNLEWHRQYNESYMPKEKKEN